LFVWSTNVTTGTAKFVAAPGANGPQNVNESLIKLPAGMRFVQTIAELVKVPSVVKFVIPGGKACVTIAE